MSQNPDAQPAPVAGQISVDGQFRWDGNQWVPLATNYREPTPWTRPMQLAAAALCALSAITTLVTTFAFYNHDSMLRVLKAQGTQFPAGTNMDSIVNYSLGVTYGFVVFIAVILLVGAVGSYLGWRWMFWGVLVLFGIGAILAIFGLASFSRLDQSPVPLAGLIVSELINVLTLATFVWMLIAVIKYGPWAMKKPGT